MFQPTGTEDVCRRSNATTCEQLVLLTFKFNTYKLWRSWKLASYKHSLELPIYICLKCLPMDTSEEMSLLQKKSLHIWPAWFDSILLNRDVLTWAIWARCDVTADLVSYSPSSHRRAAYRQYVVWYLGEVQLLNSALLCCVLDETLDGTYLGFQEYRDDELTIW